MYREFIFVGIMGCQSITVSEMTRTLTLRYLCSGSSQCLGCENLDWRFNTFTDR